MSLRGTMLSLKDKHQELQKEAEEALAKVKTKKVDSAKSEKKLGSKKKE